jgi:hypothetical protein
MATKTNNMVKRQEGYAVTQKTSRRTKNIKITSPSEVAKQIPISISPSSSLYGFSGIKFIDKKEFGMIIAAYQDLSIAHLSNQSNVRSSKTNVSKSYYFGIVLLEIKLRSLIII